jgi:hypothetical protein
MTRKTCRSYFQLFKKYDALRVRLCQLSFSSIFMHVRDCLFIKKPTNVTRQQPTYLTRNLVNYKRTRDARMTDIFNASENKEALAI